MQAMRHLTAIFLILCGFLSLTACSSILPDPKLIASIETSKSLNPNEAGRPSPLVVDFFQLKEVEAFNNAEFFDLYDKGKETLGGDYVAMSKVNLLPNTTAKLTLRLKPDVKYIGVVAAYRDMQGVVWRKIIPIDFSWGRKKIRLRFTQQGVDLYSVMKTGTDINMDKPELKQPNLNDWASKQDGPDMNFEIIKHGN